jgi:hypothetical protein
MIKRIHRPSSALTIALVAVVILGDGPAGAAKRLYVTGRDIVDRTITAADIKPGSLTPAVFRKGSLVPGPAGAPGAPGPQGLEGEQGYPGQDGAAGAEGPKGLRGDAGPAGAPGVTGPAGVPGATGPAGAKGATGATGAVGPPGSTGSQGMPGSTGDPGSSFAELADSAGPLDVPDVLPAPPQLPVPLATLAVAAGNAVVVAKLILRNPGVFPALATCTLGIAASGDVAESTVAGKGSATISLVVVATEPSAGIASLLCTDGRGGLLVAANVRMYALHVSALR